MKEIRLHCGLFAIVDDSDFKFLSMWKWHNNRGYAAASDFSRRVITMHRLIMGFPSCMIDHRDGNGLNNSRSNLRLASSSQNSANSRMQSGNMAGYKGITQHRSKWSARICVNGKTFCLGSFSTKEAAALAYDAAAMEHFGEFARLNFPAVCSQPLITVDTI